MEQDLLAQLLEWVRGHYFGKYRGTVTDNADPTHRGRLLVRVPAVLGDLDVWAMPCVPYAGKEVGFFFLPEKDTGVWVEFEAGDASYPVWTGCFWADQELPGEDQASLKTLRTASLTLSIDDEQKLLTLEMVDGGKLTVGEEISAERDKARLALTASTVTSEVGGKKTELSSSSFSVNGGALEVT
ncbi:phage baseplate assembly protein V [Myxococcus sp. RHSTA-1-4]|uniref:phage baseplate assembly protein V n=1 Tax=Myxococcus sp. RHSTA-1-4 TaxID=2874601 RepID=UPI001CBC2CCC|nr:phage baseplate assembly protein V [Myxococcus sp. RHSTA-1-4]MBZ4420175.1 phage baseplate assembly protein V [Myxococcus sp. RHSTA-1-4]